MDRVLWFHCSVYRPKKKKDYIYVCHFIPLELFDLKGISFYYLNPVVDCRFPAYFRFVTIKRYSLSYQTFACFACSKGTIKPPECPPSTPSQMLCSKAPLEMLNSTCHLEQEKTILPRRRKRQNGGR